MTERVTFKKQELHQIFLLVLCIRCLISCRVHVLLNKGMDLILRCATNIR